MVSVIKIASYICDRYQKIYGRHIDEMKLHKLLYFTQRECIIQTGKPLFYERFSAWKYGPVMVPIRQLYKTNKLQGLVSESELIEYKDVFDKVFEQYAPKQALSLIALSHSDYAWRHARGLLGRDESCDVLIDNNDIKIDAERLKTRRVMLRTLKLIEEKENRV